MSVLIDGKKIAQEIKDSIKSEIDQITGEIFFDIVYVGSDPVIDNFIKYKKRFGFDLGVTVKVHNFPSDISQEGLIQEVEKIEALSQAMIVQLPLPDHITQSRILDLVPAHKDVDVLGAEGKAAFRDSKTRFFPAVTGSIVHILDYYHLDLAYKNIVVIGNGTLVGKPLKIWLEREGYSYSEINKETSQENRRELLLAADIIISGAGHPGLVQVADIKPGVVLVDAGTSESGKKIIGDIHPDCLEKSSFMTPVPGGIGPITIAILYQNILTAYKQNYE